MPVNATSKTATNLSHEALVQRAQVLMQGALGFKDCPVTVTNELVAAGRMRHTNKDELLARRGDAQGHVGMVVDGLVDCSVLRADGHRHLLGLLLPGDFYGFSGLIGLQNPRHSHDICGRGSGHVLQIPRATFLRLRAEEPALVLACELQLAQRLSLMFERAAIDPAIAVTARVAAMLQMLGQLYGRHEGGRITIDLRLSQSDMADWLGMGRQRVNFGLKQLEAVGVISLHYSALTILDTVALADSARN